MKHTCMLIQRSKISLLYMHIFSLKNSQLYGNLQCTIHILCLSYMYCANSSVTCILVTGYTTCIQVVSEDRERFCLEGCLVHSLNESLSLPDCHQHCLVSEYS